MALVQQPPISLGATFLVREAHTALLVEAEKAHSEPVGPRHKDEQRRDPVVLTQGAHGDDVQAVQVHVLGLFVAESVRNPHEASGRHARAPSA